MATLDLTHTLRRFVAALALALVLACPALSQAPGSVVAQLKLSQTSGGFGGALDDDDRFGAAVAVLGDLDGDGVADLAVSAPRDDDGQPDAGAVWILFLLPDGSVRDQSKISATEGGLRGSLAAGDLFGWSLAALGDVDGDGVADLAVGALGDGDGQPHAGAVWILLLATDGTVRDQLKISATEGGFPGALATADGFGSALAGLGDLDGDGVADLAVGAHGNDDGQPQAGAVWILFLKRDGSVRDALEISASGGGFRGPLASDDALGTALARLGGLADDGLVALAAGAPGDDEGATDAGAIWILRLTSAGLVSSQTRIPASAGGLTPQAGDNLGRSLAAAGDIDGDGVGDLLAGTPGAEAGSPMPGALRVLLLAADDSAAGGLVLSNSNGGLGNVLNPGDGFGIAVAAAPGDSGPRAYVGAWRDDDGGLDRGAVRVLQLLGDGGAPAFEPPLETLPGQAGQPTILFPVPSGAGDDFINEPVVVVPTSTGTLTLSEFIAATSGSLGLETQATVPTGLKPSQAQTADFSGDGQRDLLVANFGGDSVSLHVQLSTASLGNQSFAPKIDFPLPFDDFPVALRTADVDQDGNEDVVVAGDGGVTTLLGSGLGQFTAVAFAPVANLSDLQLADLDGDGRLDVVATSGAPVTAPAPEIGFATVLLGTGSGAFTSGDVFATGHAVASVLLADFDGDGPLDALLAIHERSGGPAGEPQGRIELFSGDGSGSFAPSALPTAFASPNPDGVHPRWGAVADIDGDGRPDAVYTSNDSLAFSAGTFAAEQPPVTLTILRADDTGGFAVTELPTAYAGKGVAPLLADVAPQAGDGAVDCILVWSQDLLAGTGDPAQGSTEPVTLLAALVGDGRGGFTDASPNQFLGSAEPGDPTIDEVNDAVASGNAPGGPDILVPDLADGSLKVLLGDGAGGVAEVIVVPDVDPIDPETLPSGGIWQGGPLTVTGLDLGGDAQRDLAVYSRWDDLAGLFAPRAAFATLVGDGTGLFAPGQAFLLSAAGDLAAGDIDGDGNADVLVTLRTGGSADALAIHRGLGSGALATTPLIVAAPAGRELTGGLHAVDVDGVPGVELLTTARVTATGAGELVVFHSEGARISALTFDAGGAWDEVRALDAGDLDGDDLLDVALGVADGRLFLMAGLGALSFEPLATSATSSALGGGAVRLGQVDGDGRLDLVSSNVSVAGDIDQAFVRVLRGSGDGGFLVTTLPGLTSIGIGGTRRPALGDLDGDGTSDTVLVHGGTGTVSVLLNALGTFASFGSGKPGAGGLTPKLAGLGYTTIGGSVTLVVSDGASGAPGLLQIGTGQLDGPFLAVKNVAAELPLVLSGKPGVPHPGGWSLTLQLPDDSSLAGLEVVLQVILHDPAAGPPGPVFLSLSNGLVFTILP